MKYAVCDPNGRIAMIAVGPANSMAGICQPGQTLLEVGAEVHEATHYVVADAVVPFPAKPSQAHVWNWALKAWDDPRTLADHRAARMAVLKRARDNFLYGGFTWDGSRFDSDETSQTRLLGLVSKARFDSAMVEYWRLADNSWRALNATAALAVWNAFENHMRSAFQTFAILEAAVAAATTRAAIEGVIWP